jgi:hypothetical protein
MTISVLDDWQLAITQRLEIAPTFPAMQRYLLFARRSTGIEQSTPAPGAYHFEVTVEETIWFGDGASADEAMARAILSLPNTGEENT